MSWGGGFQGENGVCTTSLHGAPQSTISFQEGDGHRSDDGLKGGMWPKDGHFTR